MEIVPNQEFLLRDSIGQKLVVMLKLQPTEELVNVRSPTAIAFVIDTSGSMYEAVTAGEPTGKTLHIDGQIYHEVKGCKTKIDIVIESLLTLIRSGRLTASD
jgi:Ca-activated chloride channel family protein